MRTKKPSPRPCLVKETWANRPIATVATEQPRSHETAAIFAIGLLVYWIRPDHEFCSMREISNAFRSRKLVPCHFQWNASIWVTWSDTSHVCKLWWRKCQWVRLWTPRIPYILYVFLWIPIQFPKLKQKYSRAWTLGFATRETRQGTRRRIPEVGERRNSFAKQTWTDAFSGLFSPHHSAVCFRDAS